MIKGIAILLAVYLLYYGANIVYDLFIKKDKTVETDLTEEFSLEEVAGQDYSVSQINIEDVENVTMPDSFVKNGFQAKGQAIESAGPDLEDLRSRFEAELDMDDENREAPIFPETENKQVVSKLGSVTPAEIKIPISEDHKEPMADNIAPLQKEKTEVKKNDWQEMLRLSETSVQMVANYDGQKVYSII